jgi:MFS family permease
MNIYENSSHDGCIAPTFPAQIEETSLYAIRSDTRCQVILAIVSFMAILLPFCDTIHLPSLGTIERNLQTIATLVAVSVSIYVFMNGLFSLVWGALSNRFGRKITLIIALALFVAVSIVCICAPNVNVWIVFRARQCLPHSSLDKVHSLMRNLSSFVVGIRVSFSYLFGWAPSLDHWFSIHDFGWRVHSIYGWRHSNTLLYATSRA